MAGSMGGFRRMGRKQRRKMALLVLLVLLLVVLAYSAYYFTLNRALPKIVVAPTQKAQSIAPPQFLYAISGAGKNLLGRPIGVVIGKDGRVYVSDATQREVFIFSPQGNYLSSFSALKDGKNKKLVTPVHMAFNNDKTELYVADRALDALYVFDPNGKYLRKYTGPTLAGKPVTWSPLALTFGPDGKLYTTDVRHTEGHRIVIFDPTGKQLLSWGRSAQVDHPTDQPGSFYFPNGIAVGSDGTIYVVDGDNRRVQVFDSSGKFESAIDYVGIPRGIWLDQKKKYLIISDALANQVDIYSLKGEKLTTFGEGGAGPGQFKFPNDITLDDSGRIYIADRENHQVQVWGWPQAAVPVPVTQLAQRWGWCLSPLLLLPLLLLRRRREVVVTIDFIDELVRLDELPSIEQPKLKWTTPEEDHQRSFAGRVEMDVDLGELVEPVEYSESDARDLVETLECGMPQAVVLAIAKRAGRLATENEELRHLATLLELDVFGAREFLDRVRKAEKK